jgi:ornithine cyclodeaminase
MQEPSDKALVPFVTVAHMMALLHRIGPEVALREIAAVIETDFRRWDSFDRTPRLPAHSPQGVIELMPTTDGVHYSFKYVNGHPGNARTGLQTVAAFGLLAEVATGYPVLLTEMTLLTALRTAAMSAVAARHLARPGVRTHALIGNGAQSEFQALAIRALTGADRLRLFDTDPAATAKLMRNLAPLGFSLVACDSAEDAAAGADIVTTVTADKRNARVLAANAVAPGQHLNAVGGDCPGKTELPPELLPRCAIFVEHPPQTRVEGEIQQLPSDHPVTELHRVIAGTASGRRGPEDITLFDSVGFAIEDFSALLWLKGRVTPDLCQPLDLIADPDDPRDLWGMLMRAGPMFMATSAGALPPHPRDT